MLHSMSQHHCTGSRKRWIEIFRAWKPDLLMTVNINLLILRRRFHKFHGQTHNNNNLLLYTLNDRVRQTCWVWPELWESRWSVSLPAAAAAAPVSSSSLPSCIFGIWRETETAVSSAVGESVCHNCRARSSSSVACVAWLIRQLWMSCMYSALKFISADKNSSVPSSYVPPPSDGAGGLLGQSSDDGLRLVKAGCGHSMLCTPPTRRFGDELESLAEPGRWLAYSDGFCILCWIVLIM